MGVKPMSPSANFTTYRLPTSRSKSDLIKNSEPDAFVDRLARPKSAGLFRFLLCSRPCFHQYSVDMEEENHHPHHHAAGGLDSEMENGSSGDLDCQLRTELQAVMRHLEVRWQLFDEALSRFGDLEAMLAICAEKVRWRHHTANGIKEAHAAEDLRSLIARKLSMEVSIQRIVQLSITGELGTSLDLAGQLGQSWDRMPMQAALEFFYESPEEIGNGWIECSRPCVLEEDTYILCNQRGEVVEEGKQVVLWEQYNATWYIRGCVSYPTTSKLHA